MKNFGIYILLLLPYLATGAEVRRDAPGLKARQLDSLISKVVSDILPGSSTDSSSSSTTSDESTSTPTSTEDNTPTSTTPTTPTSSSTTSHAPPTSQTTPPTTPQTSSNNPASTQGEPQQSTVTNEVPIKTFTRVITDSAGQIATTTFMSVADAAATSGSGLAGSGGGDGGTAHVTAAQKRIIIGVVVGVGGFLVLAGIAGIAWRIWGKRGKGLNRSNTVAAISESRSESKPTIHSVDHYQKPPNVNQSSNF